MSTLIAPPHRHAVVVVDADHRFDATCLVAAEKDESLPASRDDLRHVYVYRPARSSFRANVTSEASDQAQACVAAARQHMLYGAHASRDRAWWGTVVVGGSGGDLNAGWKGWMDVRRSEVAPFGVGLSLEEALLERERRHERVRERGWEGRCREGVYSWK